MKDILKTKYKDILLSCMHMNFKKWKSYLSNHYVTFDIVELLDGQPQGLKYHPEFCALKHTYLVCKAVYEVAENHDLLEAALLHDVGKSSKTTIGVDRIYSYGHANASAEYVERHRNNITDFDLTYDVVKRHMNWKNGSRNIPTPELETFINCDKNISKKLYSVYFPWYDEHINKIREWWTFVKQRNSSNIIHVMVGIPGSGKTSYIKNNLGGIPVVSPDDIRREVNGDVSDQSNAHLIWDITKSRLLENLFQTGEVVLDATNVNKFYRVEFMSSFNSCYKVAHVFHVEPEIAFKRITKDIEKGVDRSNVPEKVIHKMHKNFNRGLDSLNHEFNKVIHNLEK